MQLLSLDSSDSYSMRSCVISIACKTSDHMGPFCAYARVFTKVTDRAYCCALTKDSTDDSSSRSYKELLAWLELNIEDVDV